MDPQYGPCNRRKNNLKRPPAVHFNRRSDIERMQPAIALYMQATKTITEYVLSHSCGEKSE